VNIKRPQNIPPYAEACLQALGTTGLGHHISLGGAFALLHYIDYRTTHDIDAWWQPEATARDKEAVISTIVTTLESFGTVHIRNWQEVTRTCWQLWQQRQQLRRFDDDLTQAKFAVRVRLLRIEQRRPLHEIQELPARAAAEQLRNWYKSEFLDDTNDA